MLKKHMAACLVASVFAAAPAFAQTSTTQSGSTDRPAATGSGSTTTGSPAMQPGMSSPPAGSTTMNQAGGMHGQFMTQMSADQVMASKLIGTKVIGANNESIGDVNDVIMDRNGQVVAAVVGVGGFLGIGEKDVAIPFKALEFATREQASAMTGGNVSTTGSTAPVQQPSATGSTTTTTTMSRDNEPERVVLRMTKAELQAAPTFDAKASNAVTGTSRTTAPSTTAPKP